MNKRLAKTAYIYTMSDGWKLNFVHVSGYLVNGTWYLVSDMLTTDNIK
jgi:hypothetical protein